MYIRRFTGEERGILLNPQVFDPSYIPEELPFREEQMETIASEINMYIREGKATHLLLYGPPGTGKTVTLKKLLSEAEAVYSVKTIYINGWKHRTTTSILTEMATKLGVGVSVRGMSTGRLLSIVEGGIEGPLIVALDEVDRVSDQEILYELSRMGIMFIGVANQLYFIYRLDPRIVSTLYGIKIEYKPYTVPQLTEILRRRAEAGLYPGTWNEEVLRGCAAVGFSRNGDARIAIECLYTAARIAEREGDVITLDHVRRAKEMVGRPLDLDPKYMKIVEILRAEGPLTVKELYQRYVKYNPISIRAFRNYIRELERLNVISVQRLNRRGQVREVRLVEYL